ncbi:MAG TPA: hypothetical protein VFP00_06920, partial [Burkholderiales bacterium]|nr:hypothetical protein [Burkholderiales bacterium]
MNGRRVVIIATCVAVAVLGAVFAVVGWDRAERWAAVISALVAVAALGVGVWAAIPPRTAGGLRVVDA